MELIKVDYNTQQVYLATTENLYSSISQENLFYFNNNKNSLIGIVIKDFKYEINGFFFRKCLVDTKLFYILENSLTFI
jgi:hypothetical protein